MLELNLSDYAASSIIPSPVNLMMAEIAEKFRPGKDINLGAGYVNERTIPRDIINEALGMVIANPAKYKHPFNYGGSRGTVNLINSIKNFYLKYNIGGLTASDMNALEIIIGTNGATSILESITQILKPGIVITADPIYYIYGECLQRMGFQLWTIPEDEQGIQPSLIGQELEKLGAQINDISFFYIVTVNNPTTTILNNKRREEIVKIANEIGKRTGRSIPVFFDKAYEEIIHDQSVTKPLSGLLFNEDGNVFEIGTLSKILAPAFRIGYIIGKRGKFLSALIQRNNDVGFSASVINQEMASYILDHFINQQLTKVNREYALKAAEIKVAIDEDLGDYLEGYTGGKAGFYFYLNFKETFTTANSSFHKFLSRNTGDPRIDGQQDDKLPRTIYLPGAYCVNPLGALREKGKRQLRLSYGFEELDQVLTGIKYMAQAAEYAKKVNV